MMDRTEQADARIRAMHQRREVWRVSLKVRNDSAVLWGASQLPDRLTLDGTKRGQRDWAGYLTWLGLLELPTCQCLRCQAGREK